MWFLRTLFLYRRKHAASFLQRTIDQYCWDKYPPYIPTNTQFVALCRWNSVSECQGGWQNYLHYHHSTLRCEALLTIYLVTRLTQFSISDATDFDYPLWNVSFYKSIRSHGCPSACTRFTLPTFHATTFLLPVILPAYNRLEFRMTPIPRAPSHVPNLYSPATDTTCTYPSRTPHQSIFRASFNSLTPQQVICRGTGMSDY